jgi:carbon monoxide dehydrogenase subunit G
LFTDSDRLRFQCFGGKLAQLGQRLSASTAKKTADDPFEKFAVSVTPKMG